MKKIALTLVAAVFGISVGFAQSTPQVKVASAENTVQALKIDKMSNQLEEADEQTMSVYELPELVLEQLKYSELAGHTVISVREVQSETDDKDTASLYELVLQDKASEAVAEPNLVVRFDEYGEMVFRKELPMMAQEDK